MQSPTAAAFNIRIAEIAGQTLASHCAQRKRIHDQTLGVQSTRFDDGTRVHTFAIEAGVFARTFTIGSTTAFDGSWLFCNVNKLIKMSPYIIFKITVRKCI